MSVEQIDGVDDSLWRQIAPIMVPNEFATWQCELSDIQWDKQPPGP